MANTTLTLNNQTSDSVLVYLSLDNASGNVSIADFPKFRPYNDSAYYGSMTLHANGSYSLQSPSSKYLVGAVSFSSGAIPPSDANTFQFNLNGATGSSEEIDINVAAGVNAIIDVSLSGGSSWTGGADYSTVTSFYNKASGNDGLTGVYPSLVTRDVEAPSYAAGTVQVTITSLVSS
jgi:hypothetical protein